MTGGRGLEIRLFRHLLLEQPLDLAVGRPVLRIWWRERGQHGQCHSLARGWLARLGLYGGMGSSGHVARSCSLPGSLAVHPSNPSHRRRWPAWPAKPARAW